MNYSFRKKNKIVKYIVIHYTGMKSLERAYSKLNNPNSGVSCHYLISRTGLIFNLLCPGFKAWHAGESEWKNVKNLNDYSIGIELENRGHDHGYDDFSKKQYLSLNKLIKFLCNNFLINHKNIIYHSDISPNRKMDPGEKFIIKNINIERHNYNFQIKNKYTLNELLKIYGFSNNYINKFKKDCIKAVKRSLNYKIINHDIDEKFKVNFYNLLFK